MDTKKLKSFEQNLIDLLKDAHKWEYTEISPINKKTAYEAFLHRNFSCSIINK